MNDNIDERKEAIRVFLYEEFEKLLDSEMEKIKDENYFACFSREPWRDAIQNNFHKYAHDIIFECDFCDRLTEDETDEVEDIIADVKERIRDVTIGIADSIYEEEPPEEGLW